MLGTTTVTTTAAAVCTTLKLSGRPLLGKKLVGASSRPFHSSYQCRSDLKPTPKTSGSSPSSSSSSSRPKFESQHLSYRNIIIATAVIVIGAPVALDLYTTISGSRPPGPQSSSFPGKLEPYTHHALALSSSTYYPDPSRASVHKLLQIALPSSSTPSAMCAHDGEEIVKQRLRIRSVYVKEPSLVIERAYTPLYDTLPGSVARWLDGALPPERARLELLVKRYPDGELGKLLHRSQPSPVPQLEVRGPVDTWSFERDSASGGPVPNRIVCVVGGTGVTPAFQLLTSLFARDGTAQESVYAPRIEVLYATQDLDSALLLQDMQRIAARNGDKVKVSLFAEKLPKNMGLDSTSFKALGQLTAMPSGKGSSWLPFFGKGSGDEPKLLLTSKAGDKGGAGIPVYESRITQRHLEQTLTPAAERGRTLVLVCGPDGMVDAIAGPKSRDGQTQGRLAGILGRIGLCQEDVFKL